MKNKVKIGDLFLVIGQSHVEKTEVILVQDTTIKLKNNIILDKKSLKPLNSKMEVSLFQEEVYNILITKQHLVSKVNEIKQIILNGEIPDDKVLMVNSKLDKILKISKNGK